MTNDIEHLFKYSFANHIISLVKWLLLGYLFSDYWVLRENVLYKYTNINIYIFLWDPTRILIGVMLNP